MSGIKDTYEVEVKGHVLIKDDLGNVLLDAQNAIHPQNVARVFGRAMAREDNFWIHRIAYGNGGTIVDAAETITYKNPNDGQGDDTQTYGSRLFNETYSEIVDDSNVLIGTDPGSFGPEGSRPGGGSNVTDDPQTVEHVSGPGVRSNELGLTTEVVIVSTLNPGEPRGQRADDLAPEDMDDDTESDFMFDEIGLYTDGAPAIDSPGYQDVDVNDKKASSDSSLLPNTPYSFQITVDEGGTAKPVNFTTPASGTGANGVITYGDICEAINTGDGNWGLNGSSPLSNAQIAITNDTETYDSISNAQTFGYLRITSSLLGDQSSVHIEDIIDPNYPNAVSFISSINQPNGGVIVDISGGKGVQGREAGVQNDPVNSETERERLLTHLIFSPVLKANNRTLVVTYTLTINVARTL